MMLPRDRAEAEERRTSVGLMLDAASQRARGRPHTVETVSLDGDGKVSWQDGDGGDGRPQIADLLNRISGTHLCVGSLAATESETLLESHGIVAVISVGVEPQPCRADVMITHTVRLGNLAADPLLGLLPKAFKVVDAAADEGGSVLIASDDADDSEAGAAALAVGWLMASPEHRVPWADAPALVMADRPSARLNANYERQLRVWSGWKEFPGLPEWI